MKNKLKTTLALAAATMTMSSYAANTENNTDTTTNDATRITVGSVVKHEIKEDQAKDLSFVEYHIDQDGDGRPDVVRNAINRIGDTYTPQTIPDPLSIMEVIEVYDKKHNMWNIVETTKVGRHGRVYLLKIKQETR